MRAAIIGGDSTRFQLNNMITNWLANLQDLGKAIYNAFLLPGDFVLSEFVALAPTLALRLGVGGDGDGLMLPAVLSLLIWLLLVVVVGKFVGLLQNVARIANAATRTIYFRTSYGIRSVKTKLVCMWLKLFPRRAPGRADTITEVQFDDLDLAVLHAGAALAPGLALSASELAGQLTMRPALVQRSLDRLRKYELVDYGTGSADGIDNYRLTQSGAFFLAAWQRRGNGGQPPAETAPIK
jgi:DNA-binding MarR family transcriptional regulator